MFEPREILECVLEHVELLETARREQSSSLLERYGQSELLKASGVLKGYRYVIKCVEPLNEQVRAQMVEYALERAANFTRPAEVTFPAIEYSRVRYTGDSVDSCVPDTSNGRNMPNGWSARVSWGTSAVEMSSREVLAAESWGNGFKFPGDIQDDHLSAERARHCKERLVSDLSSINRIEYSGMLSELTSFGGSSGEGERFERLILDVLNEDSRLTAKLASMYEDILEQTDIRLKAPGIGRKSGARLQVSLICDPEQQSKKKRKTGILKVFVSPLSLAEFVLAQSAAQRRVELSAFWHSLGSVPADVSELARSLKCKFLEAIRAKNSHPRGPAGMLAEPIKDLIRYYSVAQGVQSTNALRARHKRVGEPIRRRYWYSPQKVGKKNK